MDATLRRHPNVRESAVVARDDGGRPAADCILRGARSRRAARRLPAPLSTRNAAGIDGAVDLRPARRHAAHAERKVDRQMLPAPAGGRRSSELFVAPRTDAEQAIARIWEKSFESTPSVFTMTFSIWAGTRCSRRRSSRG